MNLLFCALLLPAVAATRQWTEDPRFTHICNDPLKFMPFLQGNLFMRCSFSASGAHGLEVVGCKSEFGGVETMIPVGKEKIQEFDVTIDIHEKCGLEDGHVTYSFTPRESRLQQEYENICKISGFTKFLDLDKSLWLKCSKVRGLAVVEVLACEWKGKTENSLKKYIPINAVQTFDDKTYKCVRDGISAKLISGEFELCDKQNGRVVVDKDVYKLCTLEGNIYKTELLGCVRESKEKGLVGWLQKRLRKDKEYIPLGERALLEDNTVVKCVRDADSAKLVSGDVDECFNRGDEEFIVGDTYFRCVRNGTHYKQKVAACVVKFVGPLSILPKTVHFAEKLPVGKTMTITYRGQKHSIKCTKETGTGFVISGDYSECEGRDNGAEFESKNVYKKCTVDLIGIEHIHFTSEVIGCVSKITGNKLTINEGISVLTRHEFCEKHGKTAILLTGEAAKLAMNLRNQPAAITSPAVSNRSEELVVETFHLPIMRTSQCSDEKIDRVFSVMGVVYQCIYEDGIVIAKPIGCSPPFNLYDDDSFLTFGVRKEIVDGMLYQTCNVPSQTDVRVKFEHAAIPIPNLKCPSIAEVKNATVLYSCTGSSEFDEGCVAEITCNEGLAIHTRLRSDRYRKYLCDGERGWVGEIEGTRLETDPIHACVSNDGMSARTNVCPRIPEVPKATVSYSCEGDLDESCRAYVTCDYGHVLLAEEGRPQKTYTCNDEYKWIHKESKKDLAMSHIDRCVPVEVYDAFQKKESTAGFHSLIKQQNDLTPACYFNGRQINRNDSVFINDFVFTCAEGKEDRLELQFVGCFSEGAPANVAEKLRSRNIAQCDFSKVTKDAEMVIVHL